MPITTRVEHAFLTLASMRKNSTGAQNMHTMTHTHYPEEK